MGGYLSSVVDFVFGRFPESDDGRRARESRGVALAWVRVVDGAVPGLGADWRREEWLVDAGRIAAGDTVLTIDSVDPGERAPDANDRSHLGSQHVVLAVQSGSAHVEVALREESQDWFRARVSGDRAV